MPSAWSDEQVSAVQLASVVREALLLLRPSTPTTVDIVSRLDSDGATLGNPTQLHQVVMNLCTNAVQSMREKGGLLSITLQERRLDLQQSVGGQELSPGRYLHLTVSDTGPGIDSAIIDRVFEPYFTTKNIGDGTGMGLAMVMGIVLSCNGAISVTSQPGIMTTFSILLPVVQDDDPQPEQ